MKKKGTIIIVIAVFACLATIATILLYKNVSKKEKEYNITFDFGTNEESKTIQVKDGQLISKPDDPKRDEYIFLYWAKDGEIFDFNTKLESNIILTAVWQKIDNNKKIYIVKFDTKGGTILANQVVENGKKVQQPNNPTKKNYEFDGWFLNGTEYDFDSEVTEDITIVANWKMKNEKSKEEKESDNLEKLHESNENKVSYGDIDSDGIITTIDVLQIAKYLDGKEKLSNQELKSADINGDGKVDKIDQKLLSQFLSGYDYPGTLPDNPITNYTLYGDVDNNGKLNNKDLTNLDKYLNGIKTLSAQELKNADVNGDGKIDKIDEELLFQFLSDYDYPGTLPDNPITNYTLYGDIDNNGTLNNKDLTSLEKYLNGIKTLSAQELKNADVNGDGKVDNVDKRLLFQFLSDYDYPGTLPNNPITNYTLYGDIDNNGTLNNKDLTSLEKYLNGIKTLSAQELKNADVNGDGKVDKTDKDLLFQFLSDYDYPGTLPDKPITN